MIVAWCSFPASGDAVKLGKGREALNAVMIGYESQVALVFKFRFLFPYSEAVAAF